jgi:hypothetical protein
MSSGKDLRGQGGPNSTIGRKRFSRRVSKRGRQHCPRPECRRNNSPRSIASSVPTAAATLALSVILAGVATSTVPMPVCLRLLSYTRPRHGPSRCWSGCRMDAPRRRYVKQDNTTSTVWRSASATQTTKTPRASSRFPQSRPEPKCLTAIASNVFATAYSANRPGHRCWARLFHQRRINHHDISV